MKQKKMMIVGSLLLGGILMVSLYGIGTSIASGRFEGRFDDDEREYAGRYAAAAQTMAGAEHQLYVEECGSCHMAYPAQFLPPQSWQKIMVGLEDHFGENAELDEPTRQRIEIFLNQGSAPARWAQRHMLRNMDDNPPLRITELPHFRHEHDEIPSRFIDGNDKVGSLSQCNACHRNAQKGWFDEDDVRIPGVGYWHD